MTSATYDNSLISYTHIKWILKQQPHLWSCDSIIRRGSLIWVRAHWDLINLLCYACWLYVHSMSIYLWNRLKVSNELWE